MNFNTKWLVVEWKLAARKSFEEFSYVGVSPIPQLIYTNLAQNYPIYLGPQSWVHVLFKFVILFENWERCEPIKKWLHIILRKWDFNSKDSKWVFEIHFNEEHFEKRFLIKRKEIIRTRQYAKINIGNPKEDNITN